MEKLNKAKNEKTLLQKAGAIVTSVVLSAGIITGAATLSGCDNNGQQSGNIETPNTGVNDPSEVDGVDTNVEEDPEQNPTDEPNQPEGGNTNTSGLPADWESWGVSAEIAQARWNYILSEVKRTEERGFAVTNYGINESDPNSYFIVREAELGVYKRSDGPFPANHQPPLY